MVRAALPAVLAFSGAWGGWACGPGASGTGEDAATSAGGPTEVRALPDSTGLPVTVTLRRDSLGLAEGAPLDAVQAALRAALERLGETADFDVLAVSPAVLAAQLRARPPGDAAALAAALAAHPLVEAAEVEGFMRPDG